MAACDDGYVCTLTKDSIEKAEKELNENPKDRMGPVDTLREWIHQQPHLKAPTGILYCL